MKRTSVAFCIMAVVGLSYGSLISCKKDNNPSPDTSSKTALSTEDSLKYLMYHILQVSYVNGGRDNSYDLPTYYWYSQVPSLNPLDSKYDKAEDLLAAIKTYPINNKTGDPIDRYSFLDRTGEVADEIQNGVVDGTFESIGNQNPFGLEVTYAMDDQDDSHLMVLYADKNSPAGQKGIQRAWEITAIKGISDISYDGADGSNVEKVSNAIYGSDPVTLTFKKPDNSTVQYTLNPGSYTINPILFDSVYVRNNKKIGYFVFYTFSSVEDDSGQATPTKQILEKEFDKLKSAGISDLIVDLRYNGGGAVVTAEYLDNAIAPASAQGKTMYKYIYNDKLSKNKSMLSLTSEVDFSNTGGLDLDHVFFIVGPNTASASELTLNNLKPYMNVILVGDTTYGKPVGFMDFTISDYDSVGDKNYLADLYAINFATENANGGGGYFEGIPPDVEANDYINVPWGNSNDDNLNEIFNYLSTGSFVRASANSRKGKNANYQLSIKKVFPKNRFNGMVDYRLRKQFIINKK